MKKYDAREPSADDGRHISVAMITMNEEAAVAKVIADIRRAVPAAEIVIADSSKDRTAEIAESLGARVIRQFPPRGYGPAMDRVLRSAERDVVVTLDCDNTYPAGYISRLAGMVCEGGYDLVDGSRLARGKPAAMPLVNYLANVGFAWLASILFGRRVTDLHSGMRAYRRSMIAALRYDPAGAALPVELLLRPIHEGKRVAVVPIPYDFRIGVSTLRPLDSAAWTLRRMLRVRLGMASS